ncbi:NAD(P)H-dependent flavin oxidoreductase [Sandaracinus amylolyticus]|uniref:NAD(P)H-dependent flavin oxidoreductase n=1 Tax=Sandaracinus amylolyticus TaxID=927083 RepID=UPI001F4013B4|nr:nitronate monooxygenase [Sandaracinus amylolyticus]
MTTTRSLETPLTRAVGIEVPLLCGAMYPCSNPELIAAVSDAGGMGIVQPISMSFVHGHELREGLRLIGRMTKKPIGFNAIVEKSSKVYEDRMRRWIDIALEEGVRFFVTALGNPRWVVEKVHAVGGTVYHDVTSRKWAERALEGGVDGFIAVNARAGGHAGDQTPEKLLEELAPLGKPVVCAGGVGDERAFTRMLGLGYAGVQMGTRFIATEECRAHADYKDAIVRAHAEQVVLTEKISGVPVAVIETPYVKAVGTKAGWLGKRLLRHPKGKHWMRTFYTMRSVWQLKRASLEGSGYQQYFQAGKSVDGIERVEPAGDVVRRFADAARQADALAAE